MKPSVLAFRAVASDHVPIRNLKEEVAFLIPSEKSVFYLLAEAISFFIRVNWLWNLDFFWPKVSLPSRFWKFFGLGFVRFRGDFFLFFVLP